MRQFQIDLITWGNLKSIWSRLLFWNLKIYYHYYMKIKKKYNFECKWPCLSKIFYLPVSVINLAIINLIYLKLCRLKKQWSVFYGMIKAEQLNLLSEEKIAKCRDFLMLRKVNKSKHKYIILPDEIFDYVYNRSWL